MNARSVPFSRSTCVLLGGEAGAPLGVGELSLLHAHDRTSGDGRRYTTTSETATNCVAAAATTSRWKISWKPNVAGNGFGQWIA